MVGKTDKNKQRLHRAQGCGENWGPDGISTADKAVGVSELA